ncbi:MAG: C cytochrome precursor [Planctomycetota bacterium]|nr:MAG: C cytochrome precursor [Planctomycetota bacterium]REJ97353.1 MAG: C cytochrome precursor [Planctomycetota bacterium]
MLMAGRIAIAVACLLCLALVAWGIWPTGRDEPSDATTSVAASPVSNRPIVVPADGYVGSSSCRECHEREYDTWHASYHRSMTQLPTPEAVVGDFEGTEIQIHDLKYAFYRDGDEFRVKIYDVNKPDEPPDDKPIVLTTGSHHFQAYWLPSGKTRVLDVFPALYRIDDGRWMPLAAQFLHPPDFDHAFFARSGAWNITCNRCHATHSRPRIQDGHHMDTQVSEFGISCEACHGPAGQHVQNMSAGVKEMAIVHPDKLSPIRSAQVCGSCHGTMDYKTQEDFEHWTEHGFAYRPGEDLFAHRSAVDSGERQYWADGMLRVSGREYNGLAASPCFDHADASQQMTCLSCHQMHPHGDDSRPLKEWANDQLKLTMDSNRPGPHNDQACTQCHQQYADEAALTAHTFHEAASTGSRCYNCHMPHTTWGVMKAMRSHTISSPHIEESLAPVGRGNACNLCHLDKTLGWAADQLHERYGHERPELQSDQENIAAALLWALSGDAGQRAVISWNMGWQPAREISGDAWMVPALAQLLEDPYPVVRSTAYRSLGKIAGFAQLEYDFVGDLPQRAAARQAARAIWESQQREPNPTTLLEQDGSLDQKTFDRLVGRRNNRDVFLEE